MDDYKNTAAPVSTGERTEPIKTSANTLRAIVDQGAEHVQFLVDSQPFRISRMFGVAEGGVAELAKATGQQLDWSTARQRPTVRAILARGDIVYDTDRGKRVTIVRLNVRETKRGTAVHAVVDHKTGDGWLQKETRLKR